MITCCVQGGVGGDASCPGLTGSVRHLGHGDPAALEATQERRKLTHTLLQHTVQGSWSVPVLKLYPVLQMYTNIKGIPGKMRQEFLEN